MLKALTNTCEMQKQTSLQKKGAVKQFKEPELAVDVTPAVAKQQIQFWANQTLFQY